MRENKDILCSKHQRCFIIVSVFLYPCHGLLQLSDKQMHKNPYIKSKEAFIFHSVQTNGYWKLDHMLDQVGQKFIDLRLKYS